MSSESDAKALEAAAHRLRINWFTMNAATDETNAKLMHDWLMRRAQWLRGEEETYGFSDPNRISERSTYGVLDPNYIEPEGDK